MKKQFFDKTPKKFRIPAIRTLRNGKMHLYTKLLVLPVGCLDIEESKQWNGEGYTHRQVVYVNIGGTLLREIYTDSYDCDGRISNYNRAVLTDGKWVNTKKEYRDYQAEAAGY